MDLSARIGAIRQNAAEAQTLLQHERFVICLGQRASVCFFVAGPLGEQQVVGACTTASEALGCIAARQATFLLCNDRLEEGCGVSLVIEARQRWPALRTLLLISGQPSPHHIRPAVDAGCDGLLLDQSLGSGTALSALRTICGGGIVIDRAMVTLLRSNVTMDLETQLSPRELEVLSRLARGDNNAEIARALVISLDTVKTHIKNLLLKLPAKNRTHAAVLAIERGLVDWPQAACAR
jgi:DNA-binding NarL/FixJ family response regulator